MVCFDASGLSLAEVITLFVLLTSFLVIILIMMTVEFVIRRWLLRIQLAHVKAIDIAMLIDLLIDLVIFVIVESSLTLNLAEQRKLVVNILVIICGGSSTTSTFIFVSTGSRYWISGVVILPL